MRKYPIRQLSRDICPAGTRDWRHTIDRPARPGQQPTCRNPKAGRAPSPTGNRLGLRSGRGVGIVQSAAEMILSASAFTNENAAPQSIKGGIIFQVEWRLGYTDLRSGFIPVYMICSQSYLLQRLTGQERGMRNLQRSGEGSTNEPMSSLIIS